MKGGSISENISIIYGIEKMRRNKMLPKEIKDMKRQEYLKNLPIVGRYFRRYYQWRADKMFLKKVKTLNGKLMENDRDKYERSPFKSNNSFNTDYDEKRNPIGVLDLSGESNNKNEEKINE